jgi:hypothetical protein
LEDRSDAESYAEALQREYQNFELSQATMSKLGGILRMISIADSETSPGGKSHDLVCRIPLFKIDGVEPGNLGLHSHPELLLSLHVAR